MGRPAHRRIPRRPGGTHGAGALGQGGRFVTCVTSDLSVPGAPEPGVAVPAGDGTLDLIGRLTDALAAAGVRYCHWKSNLGLPEALRGEGDLDLLVDRGHVGRFEAVLTGLGFKRALDPANPDLPSVSHYYGLDLPTGRLVHVHAYSRLITGESLLKNYRLPLEEMLLQTARRAGPMPVPERPAELVVFVLRAMLKHASVAEWLLARVPERELRRELESLRAGDALPEAERLVGEWLPAVDVGLFRSCIAALEGPAVGRYGLARRLRRRLRACRRFGAAGECVRRARVVRAAVRRRLRGGGGKQLASGGAVIAFVGPDASGKSTMVAATSGWLGKVFQVTTGHLGKPPSTWLTRLPNRLGRLLLRGPVRPEGPSAGGGQRPGLLYHVRAVLLAWDRRALARALHRQAANGWLVVCDRYPSATVGAMDGARLPVHDGDGSLRGRLARQERRLYREIPPPDVLVQLKAPVDVAVERNRDRQGDGKDESDEYIRRRHDGAVLPSFAAVAAARIDTDRSRAETELAVRRLLWESL